LLLPKREAGPRPLGKALLRPGTAQTLPRAVVMLVCATASRIGLAACDAFQRASNLLAPRTFSCSFRRQQAVRLRFLRWESKYEALVDAGSG
jgi:hypothetical protein